MHYTARMGNKRGDVLKIEARFVEGFETLQLKEWNVMEQ